MKKIIDWIVFLLLFLSIKHVDAAEIIPDDGVSDSAALKELCDSGAKLIELPAGVIELSETWKLPSHITIAGKGMEATELFLNFKGTGIEIDNESHINLKDFAITHNTPKPKYKAGGYGIDGGRGNGWDSSQKFIKVERVWFHDIQSVGLTMYRGCDHWSVTDCRFERFGRAAFSGNSIRNTIIANNYFGETGDDGIGLNGGCLNVTVTGNYFYKCGSVGVTPAAGIKCHGIGCTFVGNTFNECFTAISFQHEVTTPNNFVNGYGQNAFNVFANNTIHEVPDYMDYEVSSYDNCAAIKVKDSNNLKITGNQVYAITPTGKPKHPLWIIRARDLQSTNNTYVGSNVKVATGYGVGNLQFHRDRFINASNGVEDITKNFMFRVNHSTDIDGLLLDTCEIDPTYGTFFRVYSDSSVKAKLRNCKLGSPLRIGFPVGVGVDAGGLNLRLADSSKSRQYRGLQIAVLKGKKLNWTDGTQAIPVVARENHERKDKVLFVEPYTTGGASMNINTAWLEFDQSPAKSGKTRIVYEASGGTTMEVDLENNDIPDLSMSRD